MESIGKFTQILFVVLLALILAAGTSSADIKIRLHDSPSMTTADCAGVRHISGEQQRSNRHSSGTASHCCSIGHCWAAMQMETPAIAFAVPGFRVADLTQEIAVIPASTRLEKPPQQI